MAILRPPPARRSMALPPLTSKQRAHLRGLAHSLKPLLHVGKEGVTPEVVRAAVELFHTRELLKVKVLEAAPGAPREEAEALVRELEGTYLVQVTGRTAVLYRPDPDQRTIRLPD